MNTVPVRLGSRSYLVLVSSIGMRGLGAAVKGTMGTPRVAIITDRNVAPLYVEPVMAELRKHDCAAEVFVMPVGERSKTVRTATRIWSWLAEAGFQRKGTAVLALGGGVVGDVAGFVASTYMRGVDLVQVPTTLLAQVDSSVGGKTGFNLGSVKNTVGTFYQPRVVYASLAALTTLRKRDYRAGLAEVVKHGVLARPGILRLLVDSRARVLERDPEVLGSLVAACCEVKRDVVEQDERESGLRKTLNFGHTLGHAIETWTGHRKRHGEAVALGMISACRVSEHLGYCGPEVREELQGILAGLGLDTDDGPYWRPEVVQVVRKDKKVRGEHVDFVVVKQLGEVAIHRIALTELLEMVGGRHPAS